MDPARSGGAFYPSWLGVEERLCNQPRPRHGVGFVGAPQIHPVALVCGRQPETGL